MVKTIGIIGSGMIGSALARLSINAGFNVIVSNSRGADTLSAFIRELGSHAKAASVEEAAKESDLIIVAIPMKAYSSLPAAAFKNKIVIDTMNYYPGRDGQIPELDAAKLTSSELLQQHLQGAKVVKALHNLDFHHLYTNASSHNNTSRTTLPIAGDDVKSKQEVAAFMNAIGYNSVDIGSLSESWKIEPGTPIYVMPYVPKIPDGLTEEEARKWYLETPGTPVSEAQAKELVSKAVRSFPVGGFPEVLPSVHIALVKEEVNKRK